jgi:hypothetical protein
VGWGLKLEDRAFSAVMGITRIKGVESLTIVFTLTALSFLSCKQRGLARLLCLFVHDTLRLFSPKPFYPHEVRPEQTGARL